VSLVLVLSSLLRVALTSSRYVLLGIGCSCSVEMKAAVVVVKVVVAGMVNKLKVGILLRVTIVVVKEGDIKVVVVVLPRLVVSTLGVLISSRKELLGIANNC
jgi:hypothetical protein